MDLSRQANRISPLLSDDRVLYVLAAAAGILLLLTFTLHPEPGWRKTELSGNSAKFVTVAVGGDGQPHAAWGDTDNGSVMYATDPQLPLIGDYVTAVLGRSWRTEVADSTRGSFLDIEIRDGRPHLAYHYPQPGHAELLYAVRERGEWNRSRVDWTGISGPQVGRFVSLTFYRGEPAIAYYAVRGKRLMLAEREGNLWERTELESEVGSFTDAEACGSDIYIATAEVAGGGMVLGTYNGTWRSTPLDASTSGQIGLETKECEPYLAYLNRDTGQVEVRKGEGAPAQLGRGDVTRASLDYSGEFALSYGWYGNGLRYASSQDGGEWKTEVVDGGSNAGVYSDVALAPSGNVHLIYTNGTGVVHAENTRGTSGTARAVLWALRALLAAITVVALARTGRGKEFIGRLEEELA